VPQILNKQFIEESEKVKTIPDLRPGDIIELRMVNFLSFFTSPECSYLAILVLVIVDMI
jgi:hypothetical protein